MDKIFAYILDTETHDKKDPQAIEVAWIKLSDDGNSFCQRYKPALPISFGAMAIHNIIESDLDSCPPSGSFVLPDDCRYLIGHNISFDYGVIGSPDGILLIDTLSLSRLLFDDEDSHTQMACLYRINPLVAQSMAHEAHGAAADVAMNLLLFDYICGALGTRDFDLLHQISEKAKIPRVISFGKYAGMSFDQIPYDYKAWYKRQSETDPFVIRAMNGEQAIAIADAKAMVSGS
jgi:exodeoxyribonuclease X